MGQKYFMSDIYQTHVCRLPQSIVSLKKKEEKSNFKPADRDWGDARKGKKGSRG